MTTSSTEWFSGSKTGLRQVARRRGSAFILNELYSNCVDAGSGAVDITATLVEGRAQVEITVTDDGDGFARLADAWTLFGESTRKTDADKSGRFGLGDKLVLAVCDEAEIQTMTGTVRFDYEGRHESPRRKREKGTRFHGIVPMTRAEFPELESAVRRLIVPGNVAVRFNGVMLDGRMPIRKLDELLSTEIASKDDPERVLRRTRRAASIHVYEPLVAGSGWLYELGIPVVETGDAYDVDIRQKIPLNLDRDNVLPSFLREVRVAVVNAMVDMITPEHASLPMAREALSDKRISDEAVRAIVRAQHGEKAAIRSPSDPESASNSTAHGYTVVSGGSHSAAEWAQIRRAEAMPTTIALYPTHPENKVPAVYLDDVSAGMRRVAHFVREIAPLVLDGNPRVTVHFLDNPTTSTAADWNGGDSPTPTLRFNVGNLGRAWFEHGISDDVLALVIHEFGHYVEGNHLDSNFHEALCEIAANVTRLALTRPELFATVRGAS